MQEKHKAAWSDMKQHEAARSNMKKHEAAWSNIKQQDLMTAWPEPITINPLNGLIMLWLTSSVCVCDMIQQYKVALQWTMYLRRSL